MRAARPASLPPLSSPTALPTLPVVAHRCVASASFTLRTRPASEPMSIASAAIASLAQNHLSRCAKSRAHGGGELWTPVPRTVRRLSQMSPVEGQRAQPVKSQRTQPVNSQRKQPPPHVPPPEQGVVAGLLNGIAVPTRSVLSCGSPHCSAFSHVSLVLTLSHSIRVPLLLSYASWFASVLFLVSDAGEAPCAQCRAALRANATAVARGDHADCHCIDEWIAAGSLEECTPLNITWSAVRHLHYPAIFQHALKQAAKGDDGRRSRGVLVTHADMFLNVRRFHGAMFDAPWMARGGLPLLSGADTLPRNLPVPRCYAVTSRTYQRDRSWFWFDHAKPRCRQAIEPLGGTECCFGWSDLLYVPRAMLGPFGRALGSFAGVHHEVAVATVLRLLATRDPALAARALECRGSCCARLSPDGFQPDPRTSDALCGHRLNLSDGKHQRLVQNFLQNHESKTSAHAP